MRRYKTNAISIERIFMVKMLFGSFLFIFLALIDCFCAQQTLYEYYTSGGIKSGLKADSNDFTLNGKQITLFSGSLHYFRLPKDYWNDRLLKFKAAGLNTVQFYSPWNLHEETPGNFDFETGFLNLAQFLKAIKENDMFAIYRPGPYICAEWEMGGFPAWLIRDPNMNLRSNYAPYLKAVEKYFQKVLSIVNEFQFTKGGPIIALQIENEFGGIQKSADEEYLSLLRDTVTKSGFNELLFTCDPASNAPKTIKTNLKGILETTNFNENALSHLNELRQSQPNRPLYVSEFWPGWMDNWGEKTHHTMSVEVFEKEVSDVLFVANSSINFYMFFGGTNFAFMNAQGVVTSYDYNAPLSESGNYTDKYWKAKDLFAKLTKERSLPQIHIPEPPPVSVAANYGVVKVLDYITLDDILTNIVPIPSTKPKHMELLDIGSNYGQHFGFILYRIDTNAFKQLEIKGGVSDRAVVLIDQKEVDVFQSNKDYSFNTTEAQFTNSTGSHTLDVLVENMGRINWGSDRSKEMNEALKGVNGDIVLDQKVVSNLTIFPLEFKEPFVKKLKAIKGKPFANVKSPALFRAELDIKDKPRDTFLRLDKWVKGVVFVNGYNVGRYWEMGPQKTLYIPAPFLKSGTNDIFVFELHSANESIQFVDKPDLGKE